MKNTNADLLSAIAYGRQLILEGEDRQPIIDTLNADVLRNRADLYEDELAGLIDSLDALETI